MKELIKVMIFTMIEDLLRINKGTIGSEVRGFLDIKEDRRNQSDN